MIAFQQYEDHLVGLLNQMIARHPAPTQDAVSLALDGQPRRILRMVVEQEALDGAGAFFTGQRLAKRLIAPWERDIRSGGIKLFDAACGTGDLLLAVARLLPVRRTLSATLRDWSGKLFGCDIHPTFVRTTKLRLAILAGQRCVIRDKVQPANKMFPGIMYGNFLHGRRLAKTTHVIMNPPFTLANAASSCEWAQGLVNQAGVFLHRGLESASPNAKLAAILPDVLRTGTRYRRWRDTIEKLAAVESITVEGRFDSIADVDVFFLNLTRQVSGAQGNARWWRESRANTVGDFFQVNVGSVVPHRDPRSGKRVPFFDAGCTPLWTTIRQSVGSRKYGGRVFKPPFVVVRRTSSPSDRHRAAASIIAIDSAAAIENHLLVLTPKDRKFQTCRQLMTALKRDGVSQWLNKRIRCRHLTVGAVGKIPFSKETA